MMEMRNPRKMKNGGKEIEKREERRNRRRRGQRREKVNTDGKKRENRCTSGKEQ